MKPSTQPMAPEYLRSLIAAGLNKARMERAEFHPKDGFDEKGVYTAEVKAAVQLYMETWVIAPLEAAFDALETGDKKAIRECKELQRYHTSEYYAEKELSQKRMAPRD